MRSLRAFFAPLPIRILALLLAGAGVMWVGMRLAGLEGGLRYRALPVVSLPMPPHEPASPAEEKEPDAAAARPLLPSGQPAAGGPPIVPLAALLEAGPFGALPKPGPDGTTPFEAYRRPLPELPSGPRLGIVIVELGLNRRMMELVVQTPPAIALVLSPYTVGAAAWLQLARWHGHETLLELPVQPEDEAVADPGPLALTPQLAPQAAHGRMARLLAKASGVYALAGEAGSFANRQQSFQPIAEELARRGLGLLELGGNALREAARAAGIRYASARVQIDRGETPEALDRGFAALEAAALAEGAAIGYMRPLPLSLDRLAQWLPSLPAKGFVLVPPSALFE